MTSVGLFVPLVAKPSQTDAIVEFFNAGYNLVPSEPLTREWYAVKFEDSNPPSYALFDTFAAEQGRQAHLSGQIAKALLENASTLLDASPEVGQVDVLVSLVKPVKEAGSTAGVTKGLRVFFTAKPDKVDDVRNFLKGAIPLVEAEPGTTYWYAVEFPGTNKFGVIDFFPDDTGRGAHVAGKVAAALFGSAEELLTGAPELIKLEVIAAKVQ
ncbi:hypothetical protein EV361DRAFT_932418 [Lentinula raphanica]|uniref:Antibiotic biosynthesis monooxygenase n=1 Tax=Lentinula raphanica TaxID=153919 RepID=A0AA38PEL2_9AGAR|nr:hypothetical protein C8R42DRAFT_633760 [Lentinula raphanica]KAJ3767352.1 hypothetical protein FB446DRAFT_755166 [Lentinula raphanica]KAJ3825266.1 hypothetical protein F5880DRAFT_254882 [Lentinula raphanica]KAJ3841301.1 hypothetical protein F5878DRAFT_610566 [Lentinula raphanica]KAJ3967071.1 hypothetical protein EV361DRAFT_932418 [Lentinula raphanica]